MAATIPHHHRHHHYHNMAPRGVLGKHLLLVRALLRNALFTPPPIVLFWELAPQPTPRPLRLSVPLAGPISVATPHKVVVLHEVTKISFLIFLWSAAKANTRYHISHVGLFSALYCLANCLICLKSTTLTTQVYGQPFPTLNTISFTFLISLSTYKNVRSSGDVKIKSQKNTLT